MCVAQEVDSLRNLRDPVATADMLVFESYNAVHASDYSELQHRVYNENKDVTYFGEEQAKIEATVTIDYVEHLLARRAADQPLAEKGQRALEAINRHIEGYTEMDAETRQSRKEDLINLIIATPHGGPDKRLPERLALSTRELYAYEKAADTQGVKGIVAYFSRLIPRDEAKKLRFMAVLKKIPIDPTDPSSAGQFFEITSKAANRLFDAGIAEFTPAQRQVAEAEYGASGATWADGLRRELEELIEAD